MASYFWDVVLGVFICRACDYAGDTEDEMQHHACPAVQFRGWIAFGCGKHPRNAMGASKYEIDCIDCQRQPMVAWFDGDPPIRELRNVAHGDALEHIRTMRFQGEPPVNLAACHAHPDSTECETHGKECAAERALHDLTPGGSEFVNDVPRCVAWIRQRLVNDHEITKKAIIAEKTLRQALRELRDDILRTEGVGRVGSLEVAVKRINKLLDVR